MLEHTKNTISATCLDSLTRAAIDFADFLISTIIETQFKVDNMSENTHNVRGGMKCCFPLLPRSHYRLRKNNVWRIILHHLKSFSCF